MAAKELRYQHIYQELRRAIEQGVYDSGNKIPSLRETCRAYGVSLSTALRAYGLLEDDGYTEGQERSGYRARPPAVSDNNYPKPSKSANQAAPVTSGQIIMSLQNESRNSKLLKLGAAVPDPMLLPLKNLARHMAGVSRRYWEKSANYGEVKGEHALRQQIAQLMNSSGVQCAPNDIIITNGCLEALTLALRATSKHGDTVIIESPTYFGILQVIEALGLRALEVATDAHTGIDIEALEAAIETNNVSACILMPTFHNPLGCCMPEENKQRVVEILEDADVPLIEDDTNGNLSFAPIRPHAVKKYDNNGRVLYCSSFSKTIAPGYRVGWIVPGKYLTQVEYFKFLRTISNNPLPELALAEFLKKNGYQRHLNSVLPEYRQRVEKLRLAIINTFPDGTRVTQPSGGYLLWIELPKILDAMTLYQNAYEKKITVTPGTIFSTSHQFSHHIRVSCGAENVEQLKRAARQLGALARKLV